MPIDLTPLDNIAIVLNEPKFAKNIGSAARAACNMGITRLIVVSQTVPDYESMTTMATHKARFIIDSMEIHPDLQTALAPFAKVVGTTARRGKHRLAVNSPRQTVSAIQPYLENNEVAFLFGPEDRGLSNDDLNFCHLVSAIPTANFSSLNLAQAVAVHCYEIYHEIIHSQRTRKTVPRIATTFETEGMYQHLEQALLKIDFLQETSRGFWMKNIRQFLGRKDLTSKDSNIIRGICRQFLQFNKRENKDRENNIF